MQSITEAIAERLEGAMADSSILFLTGKKRESQNAQKRRIVITRMNGKVFNSSAPGRAIGEAKHGTVFDRNERFKFTLSAENEAQVDQMLDNMVNAIFKSWGPNAMLDAETDFEWKNQDAEAGGAQMSRQPKLEIVISFLLTCAPTKKLTTEVEAEDFSFDIEQPI